MERNITFENRKRLHVFMGYLSRAELIKITERSKAQSKALLPSNPIIHRFTCTGLYFSVMFQPFNLLRILLIVTNVIQAIQPEECQVKIEESLLRGRPVLFYSYVPELRRCALRFSTNIWNDSPNVFYDVKDCIRTCCPPSCRPYCCRGHRKDRLAQIYQ